MKKLRVEVSKRFGFGLYIEFPSDWHEEQRALIVVHLIWPCFYISFPWHRRYPDHGQCSGPTFGFVFTEGTLILYHGNSTGKANDKSKTFIKMPWRWRNFGEMQVLNSKGEWEDMKWSFKGNGDDDRVIGKHPYLYRLDSGEVQKRTAEIFIRKMRWWRPWPPFYKFDKMISVDFDGEVGESTGSWKGGTIGCDYEMKPGESALDTLRRMERERKFR